MCRRNPELARGIKKLRRIMIELLLNSARIEEVIERLKYLR
jgi:hypothetical protein